MKITKIEIEGLFDELNLRWELNPDVNILAGKNGSGKSTVLRHLGMELERKSGKMDGESVNTFISKEDFSEEKYPLNNIAIWVNKESELHRYKDDDKLNSGAFIHAKYNIPKDPNDLVDEILGLRHQEGLFRCKSIYRSLIDNSLELDYSIINTFDTKLEKADYPDAQVKTVLDAELYKLQKQYLDYQINLFKRITTQKQDPQLVNKTHDRFKEMINHLFSETGKSLNTDKNEIEFLSKKQAPLTCYKLSSGEKQILVILLTALIQNHKPAIFLMDEPEISLHFDWQKKLIAYILELNPNAQLIIATHSPAIVMEGWTNKVVNMEDITYEPTDKQPQ